MNNQTRETRGGSNQPSCPALRANFCGAAFFLAAALISMVGTPRGFAQISTVVFSDDFSSNTIDPNKYQPDAPFFEGGTGDIHAVAGGGVMHFVGTTSQQWWSG